MMYGDEANPTDTNSCESCSGCVPEATPEEMGRAAAAKRKRGPKPVPLVRRALRRGPGRLTAQITQKTKEKLAYLYMDLWLSIPVDQNSLFNGVDTFLPDGKAILVHKYLRDLDTVDQIQQLLVGWDGWDTHGNRLALGVLEIRTDMIMELEAVHARHEARGRQSAHGRSASSNVDDEPVSDTELLYESESDSAPVGEGQTGNEPSIVNNERLIIRIKRPSILTNTS
ncbi:hypothetical protein RSOLAG1IB_12483 [Rhizoctonia solani AG-1 IB]|uniref:Uncharacterized protein n=1 Tax=Thanatephorus cucumeris (strain AG1-IB / isolate 7/3/14) TaxID=1108050 RepID=A0A0B7FXL8_THACB|nr:hypothetical protein RSOLAG1IB_12483 [Rhizoctonia solani AG-1 IB]